MLSGNLFSHLPESLETEQIETLLQHDGLRIERIVSRGHTAPAEGWYDQEEHEWVLILAGAGRIEFEDGAVMNLAAGDHVNIPAHCRHRVIWTDPDQTTLWLAVFYR